MARDVVIFGPSQSSTVWPRKNAYGNQGSHTFLAMKETCNNCSEQSINAPCYSARDGRAGVCVAWLMNRSERKGREGK